MIFPRPANGRGPISGSTGSPGRTSNVSVYSEKPRFVTLIVCLPGNSTSESSSGIVPSCAAPAATRIWLRGHHLGTPAERAEASRAGNGSRQRKKTVAVAHRLFVPVVHSEPLDSCHNSSDRWPDVSGHCGRCELHVELERSLADFLGVEDCITYSSGYMANVSVLSAVCCEGDAVLSDVLNHRSLADGLKLSGARLHPFPHRDSRSLAAVLAELPASQRKFIVTDGIFSMDGDIADLPELVRLAREYNAFIIVDDAHATAPLGPQGLVRLP